MNDGSMESADNQPRDQSYDLLVVRTVQIPHTGRFIPCSSYCAVTHTVLDKTEVVKSPQNFQVPVWYRVAPFATSSWAFTAIKNFRGSPMLQTPPVNCVCTVEFDTAIVQRDNAVKLIIQILGGVPMAPCCSAWVVHHCLFMALEL